jgi:hypothetical protein
LEDEDKIMGEKQKDVSLSNTSATRMVLNMFIHRRKKNPKNKKRILMTNRRTPALKWMPSSMANSTTLKTKRTRKTTTISK